MIEKSIERFKSCEVLVLVQNPQALKQMKNNNYFIINFSNFSSLEQVYILHW